MRYYFQVWVGFWRVNSGIILFNAYLCERGDRRLWNTRNIWFKLQGGELHHSPIPAFYGCGARGALERQGLTITSSYTTYNESSQTKNRKMLLDCRRTWRS